MNQYKVPAAQIAEANTPGPRPPYQALRTTAASGSWIDCGGLRQRKHAPQNERRARQRQRKAVALEHVSNLR
jgi:hypothetical protein